MQNRYAGDIGDFATYGLLRALCGPGDGAPGLSLAVVWYLVPDEAHNSDGMYVSYLRRTPENLRRYRECDAGLYDALSAIVASGRRHVGAIAKSGVLGAATFFDEPLRFDRLRGRERRIEARRGWLRRALGATAGRDIVFLDPDNGLECRLPRHARGGPKYAFYDEVSPFLARGQSVIAYQHLARSAPAEVQARHRIAGLTGRAGAPGGTCAVRFRRGSGRFFFLLPQPRHERLLAARLERFLAGPWSRHFQAVY